MCESDDTDILLLIPPDYYIVHSTDDSLGNTPRLASHRRTEPFQASVVNKLVSQVNTIQNRLSIIESQSESVDNSPKKSCKSKLPVKRRIPRYRGRLTLSNENLKNSIVSPQITPKKSRPKMYSLPSTPTTTSTDIDEILNNKSRLKSNSPIPNLSTRYDPSGNSIDSLNVSFSPPKRRGANLTLQEIDERYKCESQNENAECDKSDIESLKHLYENQAIITEIQTFLQCVDCIKSHINGRKDSPDSSIDLSFITSPQFKAITQRHFNRKVLTGSDKINKIQKNKKPKVTRIQQFLEDSKNSSQIQTQNIIQSSNYAVIDSSNNTVNSTITLINDNLSKVDKSMNENFTAQKKPSYNSLTKNKNKTIKDDTSVRDNCSNLDKHNTFIEVLMEPKSFTNFQSENSLNNDQPIKSTESNSENVIQEAFNILNSGQTNNDHLIDEKQILNNEDPKSSSVNTQNCDKTKIADQGIILLNKLIENQNEIENKENQQNNDQNIETEFQKNYKQFFSLLSTLQTHCEKNKIQQNSGAQVIPNTALVSLSSLWNEQQDVDKGQESHGNISINQKIEEERYRREHCERLIEALQIRLLESQEKLSVALKVDAAKDQAIEKLKDTCLVAQERCKKVEFDKDSAINELREIQKKLQLESDGTNKKIKFYEHEINKALEAANASQNEAKQLHSQMEELKKDLEKSIHENTKLCEKVNQLQKDVQNDKHIMSEIRNAASETKNIIATSQTEILKLQEEKQMLQRKLSEEKVKTSQFENETKTVKQLLDESKQNEKKLTTEKQNLSAEMERIKSELRLFYQRQVDTLVKDKREEYQAQLDSIERTINERIGAEKLEVAKTAAQFMRETVEKHKLEIRLLEERHKEEIRLYNIKRQQSEMAIQSLTNKLHYQQLNRAKLASKLHDLIESQWREALKIVTANGGSPIGGSDLSLVKPDSSMNIQKLLDLNLGDEFLKTESEPKLGLRKSYNSRPNSAPDELPTSDRNKNTTLIHNVLHKPDLMSMKKMRQGSTSSVTSEQSDIPFGNEDQTTYRSINSRPRRINPPIRVASDETPLTIHSSQKNHKLLSDNELQLYMKMLLEETEYNPTETCFTHRDRASGDYKSSLGLKITNDNFNTPKVSKDHKISKPPWK